MSAPPPRHDSALVTSGLGPELGGIGVVSQNLVDVLSRRGDVRLWLHDRHRPLASRAIQLMLRTLRGSVFQRPDFVLFEHVNLARIRPLSPWLAGVPYAVFLHGTDVWCGLSRLHRRALEGAAFLVAPSAFTVERAREANPWLPEVQVCWHGLRESSAPTLAGARPPRVALVGRMAKHEVKGQDVLLDAWPLVLREVPDADLLLIGDGDDADRLKQRAAGMRGVRFLGFVSEQDKRGVYASSRVLALPSRQEGFGLVAAEGAFHGAAVLGLRGTVMEELFPDGHGCVFAEQSGPESVAAALVPLLRDPTFALEMARLAQRRVADVFLFEHFAQRFENILAERGVM